MTEKANKNRFPSSLLRASNLVRVAKTVGIDKHAIEDDVEYLLYHFISQPGQTFQDFDDLWNKLHFSFVHFACVQREFRDNYMNNFFSCFLDHFKSDIVSIQCAVIFSLYFLYMSQPNVWGKNRIRVTQDLYTTLFEFYHKSVMTETNSEAALVFDELRKEEAFLFVAEEHMDTEVYQSKIEFNKAIRMNQELRELKLKKILHDPLTLCSNLKEYEAMSVEYQTAKQKIFYTPQAALATQKTLKENLSVTEKRPRLLQNVFLSSTLAQDETNTLRQIKKSSQQILNSKRRKLEQ